MALLQQDRASRGPAPRSGHDSLRTFAWSAAALAIIGWLPFIGSATKPDEGGYLMVASQWGHGSSLYGNYWVDRPPLLIAIHALAAALGGTVPLRLIGIAGAVAAILMTAALAREATANTRSSPSGLALAAPVAVAAIFLTTPRFGTAQVDGELLSVPFILAGLLSYVRASAAITRSGALRWAVTAGVAATSAAMVKQNAVDVFVFAVVIAVVGCLAGDGRRAVRVAAVFAAAAGATVVFYLGLAAFRGTSAQGLWDAVVVFRFKAAGVLRQTSTTEGFAQLSRLLTACAVSCAPLILGVHAWQCRGRPAPVAGGRRGAPDLRWPAVAVLGWEVVSIAGGGGFWLHYLLVLVPGLVLLGVAAAQRPVGARRVLVGALAGALVAATASAVLATVSSAHGLARPDADSLVSAYLRANSRPGDTGVTAFGHPNMLWDARLESPYQELWYLPERVRDPDLLAFTRVLLSADAPTWVIVSGTDLLAETGQASAAERALVARYHEADQEGQYVIWRRDDPA